MAARHRDRLPIGTLRQGNGVILTEDLEIRASLANHPMTCDADAGKRIGVDREPLVLVLVLPGDECSTHRRNVVVQLSRVALLDFRTNVFGQGRIKLVEFMPPY
jgi:hypothetical protein